MIAIIHTAALVGVQAVRVRVEVAVAAEGHSFAIVGLPHAAVRESRKRVEAAICHGEGRYQFPQAITIDMAWNRGTSRGGGARGRRRADPTRRLWPWRWGG